MRSEERIRALMRSPKLMWDLILRGCYNFIYDQMPMTMRRMTTAKRLNLFRAGANLVYRRLRPWNMPLHMQFELTNYCNLRCPVCPAGIRAVKRKPLAMDVGLFGRVIDEVGPYLLTVSLWAWGEPLLHPHLPEILRAVRKHSVAVLLSTNGQYLDDERMIEALTRMPPTYLIVAIDGLTDETNTRFRVGAKLAPVLAAVRRIAEIKQRRGLQLPVLHMRFIVMKHNQHEVPHIVDFARHHHFDLLTVRTLSIIDAASTDHVHRDLVPDTVEFRPYDYEGVHHFDLWRYLLQSEVEQVFSFSRPSAYYEDETHVTSACLSNGVLATGVFTFQSSPNSEVEIYGESGRLYLSCYRFDGLEFFPNVTYPGDLMDRLTKAAFALRELPRAVPIMRRGGDFAMTFQGLWRHFIDCILQDEAPECTLDDGTRALCIALAAMESASSRQPVRIT